MRKQTRCSKSLSWWRDRRLSVLDGHNNAPYPQSGNHTQDKTRLKKLSKARCTEYGTSSRPANPQSGPQLTKSDPSRVPRNRALREGPDGPTKRVELSTRQLVDCELKERRHDFAGEILLVARTRWNCCCAGFHMTAREPKRPHLTFLAPQKHNQNSTGRPHKRVKKERKKIAVEKNQKFWAVPRRSGLGRAVLGKVGLARGQNGPWEWVGGGEREGGGQIGLAVAKTGRGLRGHGRTLKNGDEWTHGGSRVVRYRPGNDVKLFQRPSFRIVRTRISTVSDIFALVCVGQDRARPVS